MPDPRSPERIRYMRENLSVMVALDTIELLADRVVKLLGDKRRMTIARRYLDGNAPVELLTGLTLREEPQRRRQEHGSGFHVYLDPGLLTGFGFSAYAGENDTERESWARWHAGERAHLTSVIVTGGLANDGPSRSDLLVVRSWNGSRVCTETVVGFDYETGDKARALAEADAEFLASLPDEARVLAAAAGRRRRYVREGNPDPWMLINELTDLRPCVLDAHGCTVHDWPHSDKECPHARAKALRRGRTRVSGRATDPGCMSCGEDRHAPAPEQCRHKASHADAR